MRYFITFLLSSLALGAFAQGNTCGSPIVVSSLPYTQSGNTSTYGDNYSSGNVPATASGAIINGTGNTSYLDGDDVVFAYTPPCNEVITISTTNDNSWIGLWAFTGCAFTSTVGYHTSTSGTTRQIANLPVTGGVTYYFVISTWPSPQSTNYSINITKVSGCSGPTGCTPDMTINTTTYSNTGLTTCGFGDDYSSSDACGSSYMNGEDIVIAYTPTTSECVNIALSNTGTWVGLFVLNNCPDATGASCLANNTNSSGNPSITNFNVTAGTTYYIVVSTWPSPNCTAFDLNITACAGGSGCVNTTSYGSATAPTNATPVTISTCNYQTEYSTISSVVSGQSYQLGNSCGGYITVRSGTYNGAVVTSGNAPLTFTAPSSGTYYVHWNTNSSCGTSTSCCTTTISCTSCGGGSSPPQDCLGATTICSSNSFSGNSGGYGVQELSSSNNGCLSTEHQSSWYFFQATAAGTIEFTISPQNGTDDYDFAVWGPYPSTSTPGGICPPSSTPLRCSWAAGGGNTGLGNGATDFSEGASGDKWVAPINMGLGDVYILLIDNWSASNSPFNLGIGLSGGASLDCVPLPIELMSFTGEATESGNELQWQTMAEINNDYFVLEASKDAANFVAIGNVDGAGNSVTPREYAFLDQNPLADLTYYRLKQVDFDGKFSYSDIISIKRRGEGEVIISPNPVRDVLNIEIQAAYSGNYSFMVIDMLGAVIEKSVQLSKGSNKVELTVFSKLSKGFYMLKIVDENNVIISTKKVVKN